MIKEVIMEKTLLILLILGISLGLYAGWDTTTVDQLAYKHYILAQEALAADNFEQAKKAIQDLTENSNGELKKLSETASVSQDINSIREAFKPLSGFLAELDVPEGLARAYCPMVKSFWLQKKGGISNPYYGKSMLKCGVFK
jgi:hypothetical protein